MNRLQPTCLCCSAPLTQMQVHTGSLCGKPSCRWTYATTPAHHRCAVCQRVLKVDEYVHRTCSDAGCRRTWSADRYRESERVRLAELTQEANAWRSECASRFDVPHSADFTIAIVPHNSAIPSELPGDRRDAIRKHIVRVATEAVRRHDEGIVFEPPVSALDSSDDIDPALRDVMIQACVSCRGDCCMTGGNHAYITVATISRYIRDSGVATVEEIADAYTSHLVAITLTDGCTFQHENGCVLPRIMRSDTCNDFYCKGLRRYQSQEAGSPTPRAFFVSMVDREIVDGVFAASGFVQLVRRAG